MHASRLILLTSCLLILAPLTAWAQPERPNGMTEAEYQRKKEELKQVVKRLETEYARYEPDATGFEGVWEVTGSRTYQRRATSDVKVEEYAGELWITREAAEFELEGKLRLLGRSSGKWEGVGAVENGVLRSDYEATIAGKGGARYKLKPDGTLEITWDSVPRSGPTKPEARGQATAKRVFDVSRAELENKLFLANKELQYLRYPRPEPTSYSSRSKKFSMRFTPTVEHDPEGVEQIVIDLIEKSTKTIDMAVFEFSLINVARALVRAKQRGVKIRMVYDDREDEQPAVKLIKANGIEAHSDERTALMHNKFMVIDKGEPKGDLVWTGSTNLAAGGIYIADNHMLQFTSAKLAEIYTTEFEEMFVDKSFGPTSPSNTSREFVEVDRYTKVQVLFAPEDGAMDRLVEVVRTAKKSIKIVAFAFTSAKLFEAIVERMKDGVTVEGVFESRHAGWKNIMIGPLHAAGAKVRFDRNPNALHHKVIVVDDKILCTGSFNFTDSADRENDENFLVLESRPAARAFAREVESLMSVADPDDPRIADDDDDGKPGVTARITVTPELSGEIYLARREIFAYEVDLQDDGSLTGYVDDESEQLVIGASDPAFETNAQWEQYPDRSKSPIILLPVDRDWDCERLAAERDDIFPPTPEVDW
ncbi:MAG: hypothetical protein KDB35_18880 [Acidimicrobiales bacterium]|nr:hypothetical protein [Acidimicrobiales bacterium]